MSFSTTEFHTTNALDDFILYFDWHVYFGHIFSSVDWEKRVQKEFGEIVETRSISRVILPFVVW